MQFFTPVNLPSKELFFKKKKLCFGIPDKSAGVKCFARVIFKEIIQFLSPQN